MKRNASKIIISLAVAVLVLFTCRNALSVSLISVSGLIQSAKESLTGPMILVSRIMQSSSQLNEEGYEDGWTYEYNKGKDWCVVTSWDWDGNPENMVVTVPDTLDGRTVVGLSRTAWENGPYFCVAMPESLEVPNDDDTVWGGYGDDCESEDTDYETYSFTFVLNPNIKEVSCPNSCVGRTLDDGTEDMIYKIEYTFTMDGESDYLDIVDGQPVAK